MNLVSNKNKKIFLSTQTKIYETSKVDIILSPEFYWIRIFEIPVKNISQAKKVVPTLFEDLFDESKELSYQIIKLEEYKYICFAYANQKIYEAIKQSGINLSLVNSIYFAQNECREFSQFIVEDKSYLYTKDGILVKVPQELLSEKIDLNEHINNINLSTFKVDIKLYNNFLSKKQIYGLLSIFFIIFAVNFSKYFVYLDENSMLDEKIENIKKTNNLPNSMIQIDSIINTNSRIVQKEIEKRELLFYILSNQGFEIKDLDFQADVLNINFLNVDKEKIEQFISKKYQILSSNTQGLNLNIKVKL